MGGVWGWSGGRSRRMASRRVRARTGPCYGTLAPYALRCTWAYSRTRRSATSPRATRWLVRTSCTVTSPRCRLRMDWVTSASSLRRTSYRQRWATSLKSMTRSRTRTPCTYVSHMLVRRGRASSWPIRYRRLLLTLNSTPHIDTQ